MKRGVLIILLLVLVAHFVVAQDMPDAGYGDGDVEKIQNITDSIPIDPNTGEFDYGKLENLKTKAEERIDRVNLWMSGNVSWLKFVFGMVPEISWAFIWNIYLMLFFLVVLVFNGQVIFPFIESTKKARLAGFAVYVVFLAVKLYVGLARALSNLFGIFFKVILPWGILIAILCLIIFIFFGGYILKMLPKLLKYLMKFVKVKETGEKDLEIIHEEAEAIKRKHDV
ncbi:MAG: hypothetical protein ABIF88_01985 [archaeon]